MDMQFLLVETSDANFRFNKALDSPNLSSGYGSSEDSHVVEMGCSLGNGREEILSSSPPIFHRRVGAKSTSANFDDLTESLWKPYVGQVTTPMDVLDAPNSSYNAIDNDVIISVASNCHPCHVKPAPSSSRHSVLKQFNQHLSTEFNGGLSPDLKDDFSMQSQSSSHFVSTHTGLMARNQLPASVVRPLSRQRGTATLASCSVLLRHSASVPSKINTVSAQSSPVLRFTSTGTGTGTGSPKSSLSCSSRPAVSVSDALRDHMYAMKPSGRCMKDSDSDWITSRQHPHGKCKQMIVSDNKTKQTAENVGKMSILEAFLRSTTQRFDANRGSTELAAEEFAKLHVTSSASACDSLSINDDLKCDEKLESMSLSQSSLLKQLLTGEINSSEVEQRRSRDCPLNLAVDSLLTDGLGLDANLQLDDPLSNGIGLLASDTESDLGQDMAISPCYDTQMVLSCDLDDSLQEQSRQEGLLWEHYINVL